MRSHALRKSLVTSNRALQAVRGRRGHLYMHEGRSHLTHKAQYRSQTPLRKLTVNVSILLPNGVDKESIVILKYSFKRLEQI